MKFFKRHSYEISKLIINQFGISIFALCLTFSVSALNLSDPKTVNLLISVFSLCFYAALIYSAAWEMGAKEGLKNNAAPEKEPETTGVFLGLCAGLPQFLIGVIMLLTECLYAGAGVGVFGTVFTVVYIVQFIFSGQDIGFLTYIFRNFEANSASFYYGYSAGLCLLALLPAAIVGFGYYLGYHDKKLFGPKTPEKK